MHYKNNFPGPLFRTVNNHKILIQTKANLQSNISRCPKYKKTRLKTPLSFRRQKNYLKLGKTQLYC